MTYSIGMLVFPGMTLLDFAGPYEVFSQVSELKVYTIAETLQPMMVSGGLSIIPDTTLQNSPDLDILFLPGGPGVDLLMDRDHVLFFLRRQAKQARYITSVCTGALLLGAAGLLKGYRATTHWLSLSLLPYFGAIPQPDRVVIDRNRITGGGVTAGIDFALRLVAEIFGVNEAKRIELYLEYNPAPPFQAGHPTIAGAEIVNLVRESQSNLQQHREAKIRRLVNK